MKTSSFFISLLAVVAAGLWFCWPTPSARAQERGQGVRKSAAGAEQRIALVIGNGAYAEAPLPNPVNDARDMAATLRQFGFEVLSGENRNRRQMEDLIREFGQKIRKGGVGMFYFAGHGAQVGGANYLIPVGAVINGEAEVKYEAVDVGFVLAQMEEAQNRLNIMVLDACRNNPFSRGFRSSSGGLASIDAPVGTLIAYATAPGRTASDGRGSNGLYTKELLAAMRVPGLKIEDVFKRVRSEVRRQSNSQQIPWEASSIEGDFYFSTSGARPAPPVSTSTSSPTLAEMLRQAEASLRRRDYDGVISAARKALNADPNSGVAHRFLYQAYLYQRESGYSDQARDKALQLLAAPKDAMEYEARGSAYIVTDQQRAIADLSEAIKLDPKYVLAYKNRGQAYFYINDYDRAIADYSVAIKLDPKYAAAYNFRAVAYAQKKDYDQAIADYNEAIKLDPEYLEAWVYRGAAYIDKKEPERAIADYNEAIKLDPKYEVTYNKRAHAYLFMKEFERAIADYNEAIKLNPKYAEAYAYRGVAYTYKKDYAQAIADYSAAIRLNPKYELAYKNRAFAYRQIGRENLAEADESAVKRLSGK